MSDNQHLLNSKVVPVPPNWYADHPTKPYLHSEEEYNALYKQSIEDPVTFYANQARKELDWSKDFKTTKFPPDEAESGFQKSANWFLEGELNICYNCVDRHALISPNKPAIIYESDNNDESVSRIITYQELLEKVCQLSQVLINCGVKKEDVVTVYLPMIPEALIAIMAIIRIGAIHSVVFAGFSSNALKERILDTNCKIVVTTDKSYRGGRIIETKRIVNEAVKEIDDIRNIIVVKRSEGDDSKDIPITPKRDIWYHEEISKYKTYYPPASMNSEHILYLLYTSGSTGKPKGLIHTNAGYALHAILTGKYIFDIHPEDTVFTGADIGWVAGHTYVCYTPLLIGATTVVYEGTPVHPQPGRFWEIVDKHKVNIFYIAPTALRLLKMQGDDIVAKYKLDSLRSLGVVGEPCAPEIWEWYYKVIGRERCSVQDTFWQTETGGPMISSLAGITSMKPGSVNKPFFGVEIAILDPVSGEELCCSRSLKKNKKVIEGILAFKQSWPGLSRGIFNNYSRYLETYFKPYENFFFTGDGVAIDKDGYYWILGRVDDVVNVSGHRLSTAEIEASILENAMVSENAVVGYDHDLMGQAIASFVSLKKDVISKELLKNHEEIKKELKLTVRKEIGPFATPKVIFIVKDLPKTRSGKIMRRILRKILNGEEKNLGDVSTLSNPEAIDNLIEVVVEENGSHRK